MEYLRKASKKNNIALGSIYILAVQASVLM